MEIVKAVIQTRDDDSPVEGGVFFDGAIFPQVRINGLSLSELSDRLCERRDEDQDADAISPEKKGS